MLVLWAAKPAATACCDQHGNCVRQSMVPLWRVPSAVGEGGRIRIASPESLACLRQPMQLQSWANKTPGLLENVCWVAMLAEVPATGHRIFAGDLAICWRVANRRTSRLVGCWKPRCLLECSAEREFHGLGIDGVGTACRCPKPRPWAWDYELASLWLRRLTQTLGAAGSKETSLEKANWYVIVPYC